MTKRKIKILFSKQKEQKRHKKLSLQKRKLKFYFQNKKIP